MCTCLLFVFGIGWTFYTSGQEVNLSGVVKNKTSGTAISGARVALEGSFLSAVTDNNGAFALTGNVTKILGPSTTFPMPRVYANSSGIVLDLPANAAIQIAIFTLSGRCLASFQRHATSAGQWLYVPEAALGVYVCRASINGTVFFCKYHKISDKGKHSPFDRIRSHEDGLAPMAKASNAGYTLAVYKPLFVSAQLQVPTANEQGLTLFLDSICTNNLAQHKPVTASTQANSTTWAASNAVDGNMSTRWGSQEGAGDPEWICVNLGQTFYIKRVKICWENAFAKSFKIQASNDSLQWTDVYTTTTGDGGLDDVSVTPTSGKYVRIYATEKTYALWGFSIWELEVYDVLSDDSALRPAVIPLPQSAILASGKYTITSSTAIYVHGTTEAETEELFNKAGSYLSNKLKPATGYPLPVVKSSTPPPASIYLTTDGASADLGDEGYDLIATPNGVILKAYTPEGIFRGIQTIRQLLPAEIEMNSVEAGVPWTMDCWNITDFPCYPWRGYMADPARHFIPVADIKRSIDQMVAYKFNKLHLHLSDNPGWRIRIDAFPNLTDYGSLTSYSGDSMAEYFNGYYSKAQFTEIVNYAAERYVEVIPEIDMPGHIGAALASYGFLNADGQAIPLWGGGVLMARSEPTYAFLDSVIKEIAAMSPGRYIHIGGDEVDPNAMSLDDYNYFIGRVQDIVTKYGKKIIGWNGAELSNDAHTDMILQDWLSSSGTAVSKSIQVISSKVERTYLNCRYYDGIPEIAQGDPGPFSTEVAYAWDITDNTPQDNLLGIETCLWSEYVKSRVDADFRVFPRLLGLGELGWTPENMRTWDEYKLRLSKHGPRLTNMGIGFYKDPVVPW